MRRINSTAVRVTCVALASALVPAPALAAAADFYLKIDGIDAKSEDGKHKSGIEVQSFSWGATQTGSAHVGGGMGAGKVAISDSISSTYSQVKREKGGTEDIAIGAGKEKTAAPTAVSHDLRTNVVARTAPAGDVDGDGRADSATARDASGRGRIKVGDVTLERGSGDLDGDGRADIVAPRDAASGLATGKRTHPGMMKIVKPLSTGSITMRMKLAGCAAGTRYPSAELTTPGGRYALRDLVVASCGGGGGGGGGAGAPVPMEQVTLNYSKIEVRGWDPKKKEE